MWMLQKLSHLALEWECREDAEGKSRKKWRKSLQDSGGKGAGSGRKFCDSAPLQLPEEGGQALLSRKPGGVGKHWQSQLLG